MNQGSIFIGSDWYEGMHRPNAQGYVRPTGRRTGGHCVDVNERLAGAIGFQNSWGRDWGAGGFGKISDEDLRKLMSSDHWTAAALIQKGGGPAPEPGPGPKPEPGGLPRVRYVTLEDAAPRQKSIYTVRGKDMGVVGPLGS